MIGNNRYLDVLLNLKTIRNKCAILINIIILSLITPLTHAEGLGRLFTTPSQRALMEKLRNPPPKPPVQKYDPIVIVDHSKFEPPKPEYQHEVITQSELYPKSEPVVKQEPEKEIVVIPAPVIPKITVNGIVKRSGGRSTAWVNGINTNDGYFESQHIKVNPRRIGRDHVHVEVDDINIGDVSLKVGQSLDPKKAKISDSYQSLLGKSDK